jgi:hypothetical protein
VAGKARRTVERPEKRAKGACRHHWVIEKASGPTSIGVCKHCGVRHEFSNYIEYKTLGTKSKKGPVAGDESNSDARGVRRRGRRR